MIDKKITRHEFLNYILQGGFLAFLASTVYPILRYITPPKNVGTTVTSTVAAKVGELSPNSSKIFKFGDKPGVLVNTASGELLAFNAVCTHLNCTVQYDSQASHIWCPCHNGRFDLTGRVISGPPPQPLEKYNVKINGEDIIVSKNI